jgi:hypothetical protein
MAKSSIQYKLTIKEGRPGMALFNWKAWFEFIDPISESLLKQQSQKLSAAEVEELFERICKEWSREIPLSLDPDFQISSAVFAQFITILPVADGLPTSFQFSKGDGGECASIAVYRNAERLEFFVTGDSVEMAWALTSAEASYGMKGTLCCTDPADRASMIVKLLSMIED